MPRERKIEPEDILIIMSEEHPNVVTLRDIARKLGVTPKAVHTYMQKFLKKGLIAKGPQDHYILTEKGLEFIESFPRITDEDFVRTLNLLDYGVDLFLKSGGEEKDADVRIYFVMYAIHTFTLYSLVLAYKAALRVEDKQVNRVFNELWEKRLKPLVLALAAMMVSCGDKEWSYIRGFVEGLRFTAQALGLALQNYVNGSQIHEGSEASSSQMS
jgi:predicted transcriptional regulator